MRDTGLQRPYNSMQIGTWVLLPLLVLQFLFFVSPVLPLAASVVCTVVFVVSACVASRFAYITCKTNPIDDHLARHLRRQEAARSGGKSSKGAPPPEEDNETGGETKFCWICQCSVNTNAMHCKFCDKCVSNFDHHCLWLNTCIGSPNYQYFFKTVVSTFVFVLVHLGCLVGVVVPYFLERTRVPPSGPTYRRTENWFGAGASEAVIGVNLFFLAMSFVSISLLGQLLHFHVGLRREGITTYAYIVRENANKRDKGRRAADAKSKRFMALRNAREVGDSLEVFRLRIGALAICAPCDPVRQKMKEDTAEEAPANGGAGGRGDPRADDGEVESELDSVAPYRGNLEIGIENEETTREENS